MPPPWNLKLVEGPIVGHKLPLMVEDRDIDLEYHVRHSALPYPGGQRELGILVSRLHSHPLDLHRPLWELHTIEGLEENRFAIYIKMHHSLIDGVSGMRMMLRSLSHRPERARHGRLLDGRRQGRSRSATREDATGAARSTRSPPRRSAPRTSPSASARPASSSGRAAVEDGGLSAPYRAPDSALGGHLAGQRRFATQQYDLAAIEGPREGVADVHPQRHRALPERRAPCAATWPSTARLPDRPLTAGIPVNLRDADDQSDRHRDRHDDRRAGDQRRRPARAPRGDQALDRRGEAAPRASCRRRRGRRTRC